MNTKSLKATLFAVSLSWAMIHSAHDAEAGFKPVRSEQSATRKTMSIKKVVRAVAAGVMTGTALLGSASHASQEKAVEKTNHQTTITMGKSTGELPGNFKVVKDSLAVEYTPNMEDPNDHSGGFLRLSHDKWRSTRENSFVRESNMESTTVVGGFKSKYKDRGGVTNTFELTAGLTRTDVNKGALHVYENGRNYAFREGGGVENSLTLGGEYSQTVSFKPGDLSYGYSTNFWRYAGKGGLLNKGSETKLPIGKHTVHGSYKFAEQEGVRIGTGLSYTGYFGGYRNIQTPYHMDSGFKLSLSADITDSSPYVAKGFGATTHLDIGIGRPHASFNLDIFWQ